MTNMNSAMQVEGTLWKSSPGLRTQWEESNICSSCAIGGGGCLCHINIPEQKVSRGTAAKQNAALELF